MTLDEKLQQLQLLADWQATDDAVSSLRLAHERLGVAEVQVVAHTDCAAHAGDDRAAERGALDAAAQIRRAVPGLSTGAAMLDLRTGALSRPAAARPPSD